MLQSKDTALIQGATQGHTAIVRDLLSLGAEVDWTDYVSAWLTSIGVYADSLLFSL